MWLKDLDLSSRTILFIFSDVLTVVYISDYLNMLILIDMINCVFLIGWIYDDVTP